MSRLDHLPNAITFANVLFGFAAVATLIRHAMGLGGSFEQAAWFIIIASMLDAMDGKLARRLGRQSRFGMELDSLSDVVSFGLAPAALLYALHFSSWAARGPIWGFIGFIVASLPLLFGCFRLARFNVETGAEGEKSSHFAGLPIPASAGLIASYVLFSSDIFGTIWVPALLPLTLIVSFLMVSNVPFEGMPLLSVRTGKRNRMRFALLLLTIGSILFLQSKALFPAGMTYVFLSLLNYLKQERPNSGDEELHDEPNL
jgi:CDP-diacylglycerol---serine O-phosphatidyltransferase